MCRLKTTRSKVQNGDDVVHLRFLLEHCVPSFHFSVCVFVCVCVGKGSGGSEERNVPFIRKLKNSF